MASIYSPDAYDDYGQPFDDVPPRRAIDPRAAEARREENLALLAIGMVFACGIVIGIVLLGAYLWSFDVR